MDEFGYINALTAANNAWSAAQAQKQMDFQERLSSTAHQREIEDLKAAGLNPVLSAGGNGASTPSGAMGGTDTSNVQATTELFKLLGKTIDSISNSSAANAMNIEKEIEEMKTEQAAALRDGDPAAFLSFFEKFMGNEFSREASKFSNAAPEELVNFLDNMSFRIGKARIGGHSLVALFDMLSNMGYDLRSEGRYGENVERIADMIGADLPNRKTGLVNRLIDWIKEKNKKD